MKKLLILSGKGGTGKTTTAAAFIYFSKARAFADCDVDAPNLHLVVGSQHEPKRFAYYGSQKAVINAQKCISCGACLSACRFDAVHVNEKIYSINEFACEGCGVCTLVCPQGAITLQDDISGEVQLYQDEHTFATAELNMGRGNSGKLVSEVKTTLTRAANDENFAIIDGSPGIGCPVIASMSGVDLVLIVAEPSVSGISDLKRILKTASVFQTKAAVCINKWDTSPEETANIERFCLENEIPYAGRVPYDTAASAAINASKSIAEIDCLATRALREVFYRVMELLKETSV